VVKVKKSLNRKQKSFISRRINDKKHVPVMKHAHSEEVKFIVPWAQCEDSKKVKRQDLFVNRVVQTY
jgi:hypothetical protein